MRPEEWVYRIAATVIVLGIVAAYAAEFIGRDEGGPRERRCALVALVALGAGVAAVVTMAIAFIWDIGR